MTYFVPPIIGYITNVISISGSLYFYNNNNNKSNCIHIGKVARINIKIKASLCPSNSQLLCQTLCHSTLNLILAWLLYKLHEL